LVKILFTLRLPLLANAPKKITVTVFRKNTYASQLAPDLPPATANSYKKQINTP
jgi:hypothetical protein